YTSARRHCQTKNSSSGKKKVSLGYGQRRNLPGYRGKTVRKSGRIGGCEGPHTGKQEAFPESQALFEVDVARIRGGAVGVGDCGLEDPRARGKRRGVVECAVR